MKELHRLPQEVERDFPELSLADVYRCYAMRELEAEAMDDLRDG